MQVIKDNKSLAEAIASLENIQKSEGNLLKEHFQFTISSINPINMVKEKLHDLFYSPTLKGKIIKEAIGIGMGLLTNRFLVGGSSNPIKKIASTLVQTGISKVLVDNTTTIQNSGVSFLKNLLTKMRINS